MWTQVKRLKPGRFQSHVVLLKDGAGSRIYIPAHIRHQMGDPLHCDLYVTQAANQVLIQPVGKAGPTTRKFSCGSIRLPSRVWGPALERVMAGRKMVCVTHELDRGNLRVDLRHRVGGKR